MQQAGTIDSPLPRIVDAERMEMPRRRDAVAVEGLIGTAVESCSKKLPVCRSLPTATFSGFTPYYWAFGNLPNRQQKSSKSVSDLLLHVPLRGGGYSVVNNKRGR